MGDFAAGGELVDPDGRAVGVLGGPTPGQADGTGWRVTRRDGSSGEHAKTASAMARARPTIPALVPWTPSSASQSGFSLHQGGPIDDREVVPLPVEGGEDRLKASGRRHGCFGRAIVSQTTQRSGPATASTRSTSRRQVVSVSRSRWCPR